MAKVIITAGLGFGDEGKGSTVDYLARQYDADLVVRYNGGAQAGHNVVTEDGKHHCFAQFGSGTFAGVQTYLSPFMLVNPIFAFAEAKHLEETEGSGIMSRLCVDRDAKITTPYHVCVNRMKEIARGDGRHGSCGMGVGETVAHSVKHPETTLYVRDLDDTGVMVRKLRAQRDYATEYAIHEAVWDINHHAKREFEIVRDRRTWTDAMAVYKAFTQAVNLVDEDWFHNKILPTAKTIIFEGAQGVLLDEDYGFFPYVTRSHCTFENALEMLPEGHDVEKLGIVRCYMTRHGAGPFLTERSEFDAMSEGDHNKLHDYQGAFRSGAFDLIATEYAIEACGGIDGLVVNHLDRLNAIPGKAPICSGYTVALTTTPWFDRDGTLTLPARPVALDDLRQRTLAMESMVLPFYHQGSKVPEIYAHDLSRDLGVPLRILGFGPTANDKMPV